MHGTFTARRPARQHQSQRGVAVFPPTIVISITPLDRRGLASETNKSVAEAAPTADDGLGIPTFLLRATS